MRWRRSDGNVEVDDVDCIGNCVEQLGSVGKALLCIKSVSNAAPVFTKVLFVAIVDVYVGVGTIYHVPQFLVGYLDDVPRLVFDTCSS